MMRIIYGFIFLLTLQAIQVMTEEEPEEDANTHTRELNVADLPEYLNNDTGRNLLKKEYHTISEGQRLPWTVATKPENLDKNRYDDLLAYDHSRVVLDTLPNDPDSDYINANWVNGTHREREYVATQGPLPNTVNDFWRMVWQVEAHKIIMLANVLEHGKTKVERYWPHVNNSYGDITINKLSEDSMGNLAIRTFSLKKPGEEARIVKHFHFLGWPDMGVPSDRLSLVAILQQARKYRPDDTAPIVVHCSAGVGRTGTVILTDSMLEKAKEDGVVDFPKRLNEMRDQRINVVEKEEQYLFAHQAVDDVLNKGEESEAYLKGIDDYFNDLYDENNNQPIHGGLTSGAARR